MRSITDTIKAKQKAREEPGLCEGDLLCVVLMAMFYLQFVKQF